MGCWAKLGVNYGQDYRIAGFTGWGCWAKLGVNYGQDYRIAGFTGWGVGLSWALTMDRIAGFRDLQDGASFG